MRGKSKNRPGRKNLLKGAARDAAKRHKAKGAMARPYDKRGYDGHSDGAGARGLMGGPGVKVNFNAERFINV
jgi:hypothetical protein